MSHMSNFICAKCKKSKPIAGRMSYTIMRRDTMGRPVYSFQCKDCVKDQLLGCPQGE